ncbi:hypothetical protein PR048_028841 [Dryococelus australis]|uniref:dUTPase-like domain-containing protein n=1 Tax=Dryococelus australis TaxID=614101 RepID=A0ABQ9GEC5_9NEOP|nr:hypothetical protein PR048_028841 [Dryococelus australis]
MEWEGEKIPLLYCVLVDPQARLPEKTTPGSAGLDVFSAEASTLRPGEHKKLHLGIQVSYPRGHFGYMVPCTSTGLRGIGLFAGMCDADYTAPTCHIYGIGSWECIGLLAENLHLAVPTSLRMDISHILAALQRSAKVSNTSDDVSWKEWLENLQEVELSTILSLSSPPEKLIGFFDKCIVDKKKPAPAYTDQIDGASSIVTAKTMDTSTSSITVPGMLEDADAGSSTIVDNGEGDVEASSTRTSDDIQCDFTEEQFDKAIFKALHEASLIVNKKREEGVTHDDCR